MDSSNCEGVAKWTLDRFLLLQPHVPIEGMFFDGATFIIVCPSLEQAVTTEGRPLREWFQRECRPAAMPISISHRRPPNARAVPIRTLAEIAEDVGQPRGLVDLFRDLSQLLTAPFPLVGVDEDERANVIVLVARPLDGEERNSLDRACERLGFWFETNVEVRPEASPPRPADTALELVTTRALPPSVSRRVRDLAEADEDFWVDNRRELLCEASVSESLTRSPWEDVRGASCVVGTTFPPQNIRTYLSLYSTVVLIAPIAESLQQTLSALGVRRAELTELVARGHVRVLFPQSLSRYDLPWIDELAQAGAPSLLFSRRLAALTVADQRRRLPFLAPADAFERRAALRLLQRAGEDALQPTPAGVFLRAMHSGLADYWTDAASFLNARGSMASLNDGLVHVASALAREVFRKDVFIELSVVAQALQWAGSLGAHFAPAEVEGYSEVGAARLLGALHSGVPRTQTPIARALEFAVVDDLLVVSNDISVIDLVEETRRGDMLRLRQFAHTLVEKHPSREELADFVERWNSQIRSYERQEDRLKRIALGGIGLAAAAAATSGEVRQLVPFFTPLAPYLYAKLTEDMLPAEQAASHILDRALAILARVPPEAVLLSRVKNRVQTMRSPPSRLRSKPPSGK